MSTVLPGSMRHQLLPILQGYMNQPGRAGFGLCYSPQFVALGSVIRNFLHPDFVLIGESDPRAGEQLASCYAAIMESQPPCIRMSLENAELTKIAVNAFVTTKITFANMLTGLCERIPGTDIDTVSQALGLDRRIGPRYLSGGLGYGGPCFPRDNIALSFLARSLGVPSALPDTVDSQNRQLPEEVAGRIRKEVGPGAAVAVLGLAYKPGSNVIEESQAVCIANHLAESGLRVFAYDPLANEEARPALHAMAAVLGSAEACLRSAEAVVIATPDPLFQALDPSTFDGKTILDCWRLLAPALDGRPGVKYLARGRCNDPLGAARLTGLSEHFSGTSRALVGAASE
jgi:UDPglucose 6-dehydrogenase